MDHHQADRSWPSDDQRGAGLRFYSDAIAAPNQPACSKLSTNATSKRPSGATATTPVTTITTTILPLASTAITTFAVATPAVAVAAVAVAAAANASAAARCSRVLRARHS